MDIKQALEIVVLGTDLSCGGNARCDASDNDR